MRTPNRIAHAVVAGIFKRRPVHPLVLGPYTLEAKIGEGGMGTVWRAKHEMLERPAAVKLLPPDRMDQTAIRRFEREVQLTARLSHPNAVTIYDFGKAGGVFYYAMELLDGPDLQRLVDREGALGPERVRAILLQLCGALAEAHEQDLVHRDVKPSNVVVSRKPNGDEVAKLVDFGLVKSLDLDADPQVTAENAITGSPMYMAPEAITTPDAVDARSDLYSLGALGWFLLAGRPPFEGNLVEVCSSHLHTPPGRPSEVLGEPLPRDLEDVLLACMQKRRTDRPDGARTVQRMLEKK